MIIDAHQHVWDLSRARYDWLGPELAPINRSVAEEEVLPQLRRAGMQAVILVQAADNHADTEHMLEVAARYSDPSRAVTVVGVVGYLPLDDPAAADRELTSWSTMPVIVGVRNLIHDYADPDFLLRPEVNDSLAMVEAHGLCFDVVSALPRHLEHVPVLSERHPELRMVIDHLSRPPIGGRSFEPWWTLIGRAAESPNVSAKVSGLYPDADRTAWSTELIRPFFERAVEVFGPQRLMYGGDWPLCVLAGGYGRVWDGLQPLFGQLSDPDRAQVLGGTAERVYRIDPSRRERSDHQQHRPD